MKKFFTSMLLAGAVMFGMQAQDVNVWVLGNVGDQGWDPSVGTLMTYNEADGSYMLTADFKANSYFSFTTALASTSSAWDEIKPYRFGASSNNYVVDEKLDEPIACGAFGESSENAFLIKGAANYTITLMLAETEDDDILVSFTRNSEVIPEPDPVDEGHIYLMGDVNNLGWVTNTTLMMTEQGDGIFTANVTVTADSIGYFGFTHARSTETDNNWDGIAPFRFAAADSINSIVVLGQAMALSEAGVSDYSFALAPGKYILTLDMNANTLTVVEDTENHMYIIGNDPFGGWEPTAGMAMDEIQEGVFVAKASFSGDVWFVFSSENGGWDAVNANRYGPSEEALEDEVVEVGQVVTTQLTTSGKSYKITGDGSEYTITFDLNNLCFKFETGSNVTGDANGDGAVDISDVNAVINMMLGKSEMVLNCDVNGDGVIDISDVNAVINLMLGK
jgi:hypothetical protein